MTNSITSTKVQKQNTFFIVGIKLISKTLFIKKKLKVLSQKKNKNSNGTYTLKNLVEFKMLFSRFFEKMWQNSDELKFTLDPVNGNKEYLTLDVKY